MTNTLLGIFSDRLKAEEAISELEASGFSPKDISIIMKDEQQTGQVAHSSGSNVAEGAVSGAATGGLVGGLAGLLIGIGAIAIPGIGALLVAGPLAAALGLSGIAATTISGAMTGVVAGGLVGGLIGLGVPEEEAKVIEGRIKEGGVLVAVPVLLEEEAKVRGIFQEFGADMTRSITSTAREREIYNQNYPAYETEISPLAKDKPVISDYPNQDLKTQLSQTEEVPTVYPKESQTTFSQVTNPVYPEEANSTYYHEVTPEKKYDHDLDDLASRDEYGNHKLSFWQKLKNLFR